MPISNPASRDHRFRIAERCIDVSLLAVLFLAPLVLAGRHPMGRLALMIAVVPGTLGMAMKVFEGHRIPISNLHLLLLSLCFLVPAVQVMPVASQWLERTSPGVGKLFADDAPLVSQDRLHSTFSLSAVTTRRSLPIVVTYLCVFAFLICRLESSADIERLLLLLVGSALMLTIIALLQARFGNGRFLWVYDHPSRDPETIPRGPFQNENHLSSLLASTLPAVLFFLFRKTRSENSSHRFRTRGFQDSRSGRTGTSQAGLSWVHRVKSSDYSRILAAIACVLVVCTVFATPSRGGAVMIAFSAAAWLSFIGWRWIGVRYLTAWPLTRWLAFGAIGAVVGLFVSILMLRDQIERLSYWRAKIWATDYAIWQDFPLLGIGVGNHRYVYRAYLDEYFSQTFSTGESSWLQLLVETGGVGVGLGLLLVMIVMRALLKTLSSNNPRLNTWLVCAVLAGLTVSAVHAIGDFAWHIPTCFVVVLILSAIAVRLPVILKSSDSQSTQSRELAPSLSVIVAVLLLAGNLWAISQATPIARGSLAWDDYRRLVRDNSAEPSVERTGEEIALLRQTLARDPQHVLARVKLTYYLTAELEKQQFQLKSSDKLAKLVLAQAATVAAICPTESRSYLYAATASATLDVPVAQQQRLLAQSQRLRRVDGRVALRMGLNGLMMQDEAIVQQQFAIALDDDPSCREHVVQTLSMLYPFDELVRRWQPSRDTSAELYLQARRRGSVESIRGVGEHYCRRLIEDAGRADNPTVVDHLLDAAFTVATEIDEPGLQLQIASQRIELEPKNVTLRLARAQLYARIGAVAQAQADLRQCLQTSPHDQRVRKLALQLDQATRPLLR